MVERNIEPRPHLRKMIDDDNDAEIESVMPSAEDNRKVDSMLGLFKDL